MQRESVEMELALLKQGYYHPRQLPTGEWVAVQRFLFTWGLLVGCTPEGYRTRFCYEKFRDAEHAALTWDGAGDPPGPWIKQKGEVERLNPAVFKQEVGA